MSDTGLPRHWTASLISHLWLRCWCGARLLEGRTERGLLIYACLQCHRAAAQRKVA